MQENSIHCYSMLKWLKGNLLRIILQFTNCTSTVSMNYFVIHCALYSGCPIVQVQGSGKYIVWHIFEIIPWIWCSISSTLICYCYRWNVNIYELRENKTSKKSLQYSRYAYIHLTVNLFQVADLGKSQKSQKVKMKKLILL